MAEKALSVYEVLERVLINTDRRTLLLSQRVCRTWNAHINNSHNLQEVLFFKPVRYELPYGSRRIRNPFIKELVWPWLMNKQFDKEKKECNDHWNSEDEDGDNPEYDNRYTRPEASWKRMLFQQPPTSHVGVIYYEHWWAELSLYTCMRFLKPDNDTLRLKDIAPALDDGSMVSNHAPCVFWFQPPHDLAMLHAVIMCEKYYAGNIPTPALLRVVISSSSKIGAAVLRDRHCMVILMMTSLGVH